MFKKLMIGCSAVLIMAGLVSAAPGPGPLAHLPPAVQKGIRAQLGEGRVRSVDRNDENGDVTYDVEIVRQGKVRGFTVGADGELLDSEVFMEELPSTIQQAIRTKVGTATLGEIDKSAGDAEGDYDVEMIGGGKTRNFTIDAGGKLTDEEVFLAELPEALRVAIGKAVGSGTLDDITRSFDSGEVFYDVDAIEGNKTLTLTFDAKGALVSKEEEVALSEVPDAAQKQIQTLATSGKVITIAKVTENDAVSYDVDIRLSGKVKSYTVGVDGKTLLSDAN
jgi:uncharacterized membrane protein YkoI